ncbi:hypothetical protein [Pedosphaera parvula]|uniref:Uncharacterized protein n=1 Tax=Pedosphaera parvula (strain Ellin514) TaxID=320771 RepID=B9XDZ2_PEDPL|nr:hypothetical protein [Pedosphaera parvula]EEF61883.1 hypothetical protein Cflav_PD4546 [Pedosphaera parvula Ellin514]
MFLAGKAAEESEETILLHAEQWLQKSDHAEITTRNLRQISEIQGIDFATALLYKHIAHSPQHREFVAQINALRQEPINASKKGHATLAVVPGAFYVERPETGGDGRWLMEGAETLGLQFKRIPLLSVGTLNENADILLRWLREQADEKIILISLSKGGADVKAALRRPNAAEAFSRVIAWVNVCGTLNGSPAADWLLARPMWKLVFRFLYWRRKRDFQFIHDLRHQVGSPLDFQLIPPVGMRMISIIGFPLRRHLSHAYARRCHHSISALGPNDSTVLLADTLSWPGVIYPVWGADHYLQPEHNTRNLISTILQHLGDKLDLFTPQPGNGTAGSLTSNPEMVNSP